MINDWLSHTEKSPSPYGFFRVIDIVEKVTADQKVYEYLAKEVLSAYRNLDELKFRYEKTDEITLQGYLQNNVFPSTDDNIKKNVRQGDFAEVLSSLIVQYFQGLVVPIHKMRYKFNKDRSVFCTDMMAHNAGTKITDLYYYEIKSRQDIRKETVGGLTNYVTVIAHNSLLKDELSPNEAIADFLVQRHFEQEEYDLAEKYNDIVLNSHNYNRRFELFFIIEKKNFLKDVLDALQALPPILKPLCVTVVLIDNLPKLVDEVYKNTISAATSHVFPVIK
jgi:hypothetical protein